MQRRIENLALNRLSIEEVKILRSMLESWETSMHLLMEEERQVREAFAKAIKETKLLEGKS